MYRFEIYRYDDATDDRPRFQTYELAADGKMSVLEMLLKIQDEQDPSLAFRYACRGAVCGSCAMSINGRLSLACRVQLENLAGDRVVVEPLPNFDVLKDLVVDMDPFWEKYERIRPWLHAEISAAREKGDRSNLPERPEECCTQIGPVPFFSMSPAQRERIDQYVNCILCGLCAAACPVLRSNADFTGPAALAKLYRFLADSREDRPAETLDAENRHEGVWGCHTITRCIQACPKDVRPTDGIEGLRRKMVADKLKGWIGK